MIDAAECRYIAVRAYVPEHLPAYVTAMTGCQPHLAGDFVFYTCDDRLIFVGYPLSGQYDEAAWLAALEAASARSRTAGGPRLTSITAPTLPSSLHPTAAAPPDVYYRLDLDGLRPSKKVRNLLRRAGRELTVAQAATTGCEHRRLVDEFVAATPLEEDAHFIFGRLERYAGGGLARTLRAHLRPAHDPGSGAPVVLEARDAAGRLVAFDIAAFSDGEVAFYLFNFRSRHLHVPGASDLLLARLIAEAQARGNRYVNLGLGINQGVSHFKEKWGATPFLAHHSCAIERPRSAWEDALDAL